MAGSWVFLVVINGHAAGPIIGSRPIRRQSQNGCTENHWFTSDEGIGHETASVAGIGAIANCGSIRAAVRKIGVSQTAVAKSLRELESHL
jgi:hypothetical protein